MRVAAVTRDLMIYSRIESATAATGKPLVRVDSPAALPDEVDLVLVDWSARQPDWADTLRSRRGPRLILFGQHTDLEAHSAARAAGLGPMWARSKLLAELPTLLNGAGPDDTHADTPSEHPSA